MLKFFRRVRQDLVNNGKTSMYFKYALGEILLVMIGILLALQVSNWNAKNKESKLEKRYLSELILDLQTDSTAISEFITTSNKQFKAKTKLIGYFNGFDLSKDTLSVIFNEQWRISYSFSPIVTTLDEMKSTGNIGVIKNSDLRRKILETYNNYKIHINKDEVIYNHQQEELWRVLFSRVPYLSTGVVFDSEEMDVTAALLDFEIKNLISGNYVTGMNRAVHRLNEWNTGLLKAIRKELKEPSSND